MKLYAKTCVEPFCRQGFTAEHSNAKRCRACRRKRQLGQMSEWKKNNREYVLAYYRNYRKGVPALSSGDHPVPASDESIAMHRMAIRMLKG